MNNEYELVIKHFFINWESMLKLLAAGYSYVITVCLYAGAAANRNL